jgi:hypothetical protein
MMRGWPLPEKVAVISLVVTIFGLFLGGLSVYLGGLSLREDRTANERVAAVTTTMPTAELQIVGKPRVRSVKDVKAKLTSEAEEESSDITVRGSAIDILLENKGERPALITTVEVNVRRVVALQDCFGAGDLLISALYDIKLPANAATRPAPFVLREERPFTVAANDFDRMAIKVGRERFGDSSWPTIYQVDITLLERSGKRLDAGTFVLMEPLQPEMIFGTLDSPTQGGWSLDCVRENAAIAAQALGADGAKSPALNELIKGFRKRFFLPAKAPPSTDPNPLWPVNWTKVAADHADCSVTGLGIEFPWTVQAHDITGDKVPDSFVPIECVTGDASSFTQLEVFDGASHISSPRRLGVLTEIPRTDNYLQALRTGMKVRSLSFDGPSVEIQGDMYRPNDAKACPSIAVHQTARWDGQKFILGAQSKTVKASCG